VEWDEEQRAWMLALEIWRRGQCPNCGRDTDECTTHDKWEIPPPTRCHVSTALAVARKPYLEGSPQPEALLWRAERG
jgi:hypothetical protein